MCIYLYVIVDCSSGLRFTLESSRGQGWRKCLEDGRFLSRSCFLMPRFGVMAGGYSYLTQLWFGHICSASSILRHEFKPESQAMCQRKRAGASLEVQLNPSALHSPVQCVQIDAPEDKYSVPQAFSASVVQSKVHLYAYADIQS